jgi:hypothetical protein
MEEAYARSEERNQAAREELKPLHEGERPRAVTAGAIVSLIIALIFWVSGVIAIFDAVEVRGEQPRPVPLFLFALVLTVMAWGMWRARYWAVLGFQALLVLLLISASAGLVQATSLLQAVGTALLLAGLGALFYFMIKAMARIQMPQRVPRD